MTPITRGVLAKVQHAHRSAVREEAKLLRKISKLEAKLNRSGDERRQIEAIGRALGVLLDGTHA